MFKFHEHDRNYIQRLLKSESQDFPPEVAKEYIKWKDASNKLISNGQLGPNLCIALLGKLDLLPEVVLDEPVAVVDWSFVDQGAAIQVKGVDGRLLYGAYRGKTGPGQIAIELNGDEYVHEYPHSKVMLRTESDLLPDEPVADEPEDHKPDIEHEKVVWEEMPDGTPVLVDSPGEDVRIGKFMKLDAGQIYVKVPGEEEPQAFAPELIALGE